MRGKKERDKEIARKEERDEIKRKKDEGEKDLS